MQLDANTVHNLVMVASPTLRD